MTTIEYFNKYKTIDGRDAEVVQMDCEGSFPIKCKIKDFNGEFFFATYTAQGKRLTGSQSDLDLVEQRTKK